MIKQWICLVLALLLCMSTLIACTNAPQEQDDLPVDGEGETTDPTEELQQEKRWMDDLPEKDLGGIELSFAYYTSGQAEKDGCSIDAEEQNGDLINDAMYNRNTAIEERYHVTLSGENFGPLPGISGTITPALTAGATDYDILVGYQYYDIALAATGLMYNFNRLSEKYVNIENPWWSTDYINNINYSDKLYWLTGDITLNHVGQIVAAYVNAQTYTDYVSEDFGSIYDVVRNKEWTFATMTEMAELAYVDINGNDKADEGDKFGYEQSLGVEMAYCAGIDSSARDADGNITVTIDNEKTAEIMWYLNDISTAEFSTVNYTYEGQVRLFTSGEAMIYFRVLSTAEDEPFREMEDDFYVVPVPMGDDAFCEDYRSTCMTNNNIIGLPHTSLHLEEAALVLEALAAESYRDVSPRYYDVLIKDRYTRDDDSKEMIDMIRSKVGVDFVNTWSLGYTDAYQFYGTFDSSSIASRIATYAPQWEVILEELLWTLESLE